MLLPAHISGGYLVLNLADKIHPDLGIVSDNLLIVGLIGSVLPDIDFIFYKYTKDHHNSWLHAPLFWVAIYIFVFILGSFLKNQIINNYSTALIIGIMTHLFLDWFSGRAAGIRIFYPISCRVFSFYPLDFKRKKVSTSLLPIKKYVELFKFYSKNKILLFSEISLTISGFILFMFKFIIKL